MSEKHFSNKEPKFYTREFLRDVKHYFAEKLQYAEFDKTRYFATKHYGKHNPKKQHIEEYNNVVMNLNSYFDKIENLVPTDERGNLTPKQMFINYFKNEKVEKFTTDVLVDRSIRFEKAIVENFGIHSDLEQNPYNGTEDFENQEM